MAIDRTLALNVYVIGQQYKNSEFGATAAYIQTSANPPIVDMVNFWNGNIDFSGQPVDPNLTSDVDITFTLIPLMFDMNGSPVHCVWATPIDKAIAITPVSNDMKARMLNPMQIFLDDNDKVANTYTYKLGVMLPAYNNYFISLDPQIVNTGLGQR